MKTHGMVKLSRSLRYELFKYGMLIFIWVCFLIYQITRAAGNPLRHVSTVWVTVLSFAVLLILIAVAGIGVYRQAMSYIRWYQEILDSIPVSVVVTDKDARWQQANRMARTAVNAKQEQNIEELNSRHLIDANGNVMKKTWMKGATEYRTSGTRLCVDGEDVGHIILFYNMSELASSYKTRTELINEINRLLGRLSDTTVSFDGCATSLAGYTIQQAGIICELSDVIVGIASGTFNETDELNKKMGIVKSHIQQQVESNQLQIDIIRKAVGDLSATHDSINNVIKNIERAP